MGLTGTGGTLGTGWRGLIIAAALLLAVCVFAPRAEASRATTCTGTAEAPGVLSGQYTGPVFIEGVCKVNSGRAVVRGSLVVREGSTLLAAYGQDQRTGSGSSNLIVHGSAASAQGRRRCCSDASPNISPAWTIPTPRTRPCRAAEGYSAIWSRREALGVVVHNSRIFGRVRQIGGGGGESVRTDGPVPRTRSSRVQRLRGHDHPAGISPCAGSNRVGWAWRV